MNIINYTKPATSNLSFGDGLTASLFTINTMRRRRREPQVTKVNRYAKNVIYALADAETEQFLRSKSR